MQIISDFPSDNPIINLCWVFFNGLFLLNCILSQGHLPFAVVGSTEEVCVGNKMVKARQYPWGVVQGKTDMLLHIMTFAFTSGFQTHSSVFVRFSGERKSLRLCEAEGDADLRQHGGPARADSHPPLRAVQTLQTGGNGIQRHRTRVQTCQVSCSTRQYSVFGKKKKTYF